MGVQKLGVSIHYVEDHIAPLWLREWSYEIHCDDVPWLFRDFGGMELSDWELSDRSDSGADWASSNVLFDVSVHVNPVVFSLDQLFCFVDTRVSGSQGVMVGGYDFPLEFPVMGNHNWLILEGEAIKLFPTQAIFGLAVVPFCFFQSNLHLFVKVGSAFFCFICEDVSEGPYGYSVEGSVVNFVFFTLFVKLKPVCFNSFFEQMWGKECLLLVVIFYPSYGPVILTGCQPESWWTLFCIWVWSHTPTVPSPIMLVNGLDPFWPWTIASCNGLCGSRLGVQWYNDAILWVLSWFQEVHDHESGSSFQLPKGILSRRWLIMYHLLPVLG